MQHDLSTEDGRFDYAREYDNVLQKVAEEARRA